MALSVLLTSHKPLKRAENLAAIKAKDNDNVIFSFMTIHQLLEKDRETKLNQDVIVTDEFLYILKNNLPIVMVGHGITGDKKFGLDQPNGYLTQAMADHHTYATSSSTKTIDIVAKQCGMSRDQILPVGFPRSDFFFENKVNSVFKKEYLYLPTFRGKFDPDPYRLDWRTIDKLLEDDELLIVKPHYHGKQAIGPNELYGYSHISSMSAWNPSSRYVMRCSVILTDYSSVIFDGYLAGKPAVLLCPDKDEYLEKRGMYYPYPDFYSPHVVEENDPEAIVAKLREAYYSGTGEFEKGVLNEVADMCDGHSSERLIDFLLKEFG